MQFLSTSVISIDRRSPALAAVFLIVIVSCSPEPSENERSPFISVQPSLDPAALQTAVERAIVQATDLPKEALRVEVSDGIVAIRGSMECEECGGLYTPGNLGTIQQSLGAVVRAIPGVEAVEFDLSDE